MFAVLQLKCQKRLTYFAWSVWAKFVLYMKKRRLNQILYITYINLKTKKKKSTLTLFYIDRKVRSCDTSCVFIQ